MRKILNIVSIVENYYHLKKEITTFVVIPVPLVIIIKVFVEMEFLLSLIIV
jgi:hypothetical protein